MQEEPTTWVGNRWDFWVGTWGEERKKRIHTSALRRKYRTLVFSSANTENITILSFKGNFNLCCTQNNFVALMYFCAICLTLSMPEFKNEQIQNDIKKRKKLSNPLSLNLDQGRSVFTCNCMSKDLCIYTYM